MRLAVTGGSGFCGAAVARLAAARGWDVVCLGRRPGPVGVHRPWDARIGVPDLAGVDAVVHLAAAVGDPGPPERVFRAVNVDGTARLLRAAGDRPVVHVSSASVYSPGPYDGPVREDHPIGGQRSRYAVSKTAAEHLAREAGAVVLRPRAVHGPGDPHLLPRLRRTVRAGRAWLPGPDVPMSLTSVDRLAEACLRAIHWPAGAYNIADAEVHSRDEAVSAALRVPVGHVSIRLARAAVRARVSPHLTRYALDQLTDGMVLDTGKAATQGF